MLKEGLIVERFARLTQPNNKIILLSVNSENQALTMFSHVLKVNIDQQIFGQGCQPEIF